MRIRAWMGRRGSQVRRMRRMFTTDARAESSPLPLTARLPNSGVSLYFHYPVGVQPADLVRCLVMELKAQVQRLHPSTPGLRVNTIYLGGGTPSLLSPEHVEALLDGVERDVPGLVFSLANKDVEVTMECNPCDVTQREHTRALARAGVTRISLGVQSLLDGHLQRLGRAHSGREASQAIDSACSSFDRVSVDLMWALPQQGLAEWRQELGDALRDYGPGGLGSGAVRHWSLYQLTLEARTRFKRDHEAGVLRLPEDDELRDWFDATRDVAHQHGFHDYEVSSFAVAPEDCAHARYTDGNGTRWSEVQVMEPSMWAELIRSGANPVVRRKALTVDDVTTELVMSALRTSRGLHASTLEACTGVAWTDWIARHQQRLMQLSQGGLVDVTHERVKLTVEGFAVADSVVVELI